MAPGTSPAVDGGAVGGVLHHGGGAGRRWRAAARHGGPGVRPGRHRPGAGTVVLRFVIFAVWFPLRKLSKQMRNISGRPKANEKPPHTNNKKMRLWFRPS